MLQNHLQFDEDLSVRLISHGNTKESPLSPPGQGKLCDTNLTQNMTATFSVCVWAGRTEMKHTQSCSVVRFQTQTVAAAGTKPQLIGVTPTGKGQDSNLFPKTNRTCFLY